MVNNVIAILFSLMKFNSLMSFPVQLTAPFAADMRAGLSFSNNSIPSSCMRFLACDSLAAAVSDFVAACSMATDVPVTASV